MTLLGCFQLSVLLFVVLLPASHTFSDLNIGDLFKSKTTSTKPKLPLLATGDPNRYVPVRVKTAKEGSRKVQFSDDVTGGLKGKPEHVRKIKKPIEKLVWSPASFVNGVYKNEWSWNEESNLVLSPATLELSFAALCFCSSGTFGMRMLTKFLRVPMPTSGTFGAVDRVPLKHRYKHILSSLSFDSVKIVSNVFIDQSFYLKSGSASDLKSSFGVNVKSVNFRKKPEEVRKSINQWFTTETTGQPVGLLQPDSVTTKTTLILVNTLCFKGKWASGFSRQSTASNGFQTLTSTTTATYIAQTQHLHYIDNQEDSYQMIELPMTVETGPFSLLLFLPHSGTTLSDLENVLANTDWLSELNLTEGSRKTAVDLVIPRFSISSRWNFKPLLTEVTMDKRFPMSLRLSGLTFQPSSLDVSGIHQEVALSVDEDGVTTCELPSKSLLATGPEANKENMMLNDDTPARVAGRQLSTSATEQSSASFIANKPFVFSLIHREKKIVLVHGHVANPSKKN